MPGFYKKTGKNEVPALLPRGIYFDLVRERQLAVCEEWLCHVFPHPCIPDVADVAAKHFPTAELVGFPGPS